MPIIVDREQIRTDILMAFERCIERKPMLSVSLRDIAAEAGMSHAKLLNYFESKNDLILAYVRYTREYMSVKCSQWFAAHAGMHEAEAMMILIAGTFICNYNRALTGEINDNILGYLGNLSRS